MKQAAVPKGQGMTGTPREKDRRQRADGPRGKGWAFHLSTVAQVTGITLAAAAAVFILLSLSVSLLWFIPWILRLIVGLVVAILALLAAAMLAADTPLPGRWLLLVAAGALLLLSPLLMLWLHGSWDARYPIPSRSGRQVAITVQMYAWIACSSGLVAVAVGAAGWITARFPRRRDPMRTRKPRTRPPATPEQKTRE